MAQQDATLPEGMYGIGASAPVAGRTHWTNAWFASAGVSATVDGTVVGSAVRLEVECAATTVRFTLPARAVAMSAGRESTSRPGLRTAVSGRSRQKPTLTPSAAI
jgi:hypothetical protein